MTAFEYAPAPESPDIARLKSSYGIFVNGALRAGRGEAIKTINPANEQPLAEVMRPARPTSTMRWPPPGPPTPTSGRS